MLCLDLFKINIELLVSLYIMHWLLLFLNKLRLGELILVLRVFQCAISLRNISVRVLQVIRLIAPLNDLVAHQQLLRRKIALVCHGGSLECSEVLVAFQRLLVLELQSMLVLRRGLND